MIEFNVSYDYQQYSDLYAEPLRGRFSKGEGVKVSSPSYRDLPMFLLFYHGCSGTKDLKLGLREKFSL